MAIEALKGAAISYHGSALNAADTNIRDFKLEVPQKTDVSESVAEAAANVFVGDAEGEGEEQESKADRKLEGSNNSKQLQDAVDKLKEKMNEQTEAIFGIHEGTNRVMIKIVDRDTKDVIKEYPPEKTLDMIQKVWEMAGIMVDEKR